VRRVAELGSLGRFHAMKLTIDGLEMMELKKAALADFRSPAVRFASGEDGFSVARGLAEGCMGWTWCQWLKGTPPDSIREKVAWFVDRGLELQQVLRGNHLRGLHDLFLMHCAVFACPPPVLMQVAEQAIDASGTKGQPPRNDGELYASAWCGMLKHWILGAPDKANAQSELVWKAYRPPHFRAATKSLVTPWLAEDWKSFAFEQRKDFERLWARARKDGTASAKKTGTVVRVQRFPVAQLWCWAHAGLALLAQRHGAEVVTDSFWLPPHALARVDGRCNDIAVS
jgi:hypothetical protein